MTATARRIPSAFESLAAIARLSARRLSRTRSIWIALILAALPVVAAALLKRASAHDNWTEIFNLVTAVLAVIAPLCFTSAVAEEIEDRTFTFLWSRPVPRWAVLAGKLAGVFPLAAAVAIGCLVGCLFSYYGSVAGDVELLARAVIAMLCGVLMSGVAAASIGLLIPKHAVGAAIFLLLAVDMPVGSIPFSVAKLSITYHVRAIAGVAIEPESALSAAIWSAILLAIWGGLGIWRITRAELSVEK